jgi:hypothetical protein
MFVIEQSSPLGRRQLFQQGLCKIDDNSLENQDPSALELFAPELIHDSRNCSNMDSLVDSSKREMLLVKYDVE